MEEKLNGTYYLFDCLDGVIGNRLLTLEELRQVMTWENVTYTEKDAEKFIEKLYDKDNFYNILATR